MARLSAHEKIMQLRQEFDIPEEETSDAEDLQWEREREERRKRMDLAGTEDNYVKMFHRDPWTDEPLPGYEEFMAEQGKKAERSAKVEVKHSHDEWRAKFMPNVKTVHLPAEKESKTVKKLRKKRKTYEEKLQRQEQIDIAYWWLEVKLSKEFANELYYKYRNDLDVLIDLCYNWAIDWAEDMTWDDDDHNIPNDEIYDRITQRIQDNAEIVEDVGGLKFKRKAVAEKHRREYDTNPFENPYPEIPDAYWDEFVAWCKDHPLKKYRKKAKRYAYRGLSAGGLRRIDFLKKVNKRNKNWRKNLMLHDPITGASFVSEKKMRNHIRNQLKKYDQQRKRLVDMLDKMVADGHISEDYANNMMGDTQLVRDRVRKRWKEEYERMKVRKKEEMKRYKHQKKTYEARKKWYEKHGGDINSLPAVFDADGKQVRIKAIPPAKKGGRVIYCVDDGDGNTTYSESSLKDALNIDRPPREPVDPVKPIFDKDYWDSYRQLPKY